MSYTHSEQTAEIAKALSALQSKCGGMGKSGVNKHLGNRYALFPDCWEVVRPHLAPNGLAIVQALAVDGDMAGVVTHALHSSGEWIRTELMLPVTVGKGVTLVQAIGSTTSYAKRYALMALCGLAEDEHDDDGNTAGYRAPAIRNQSKCMDEALAARALSNRPKRIPPVRPRVDPDKAAELDDTRDAILALVPKLPADQQDGAKDSANGARNAADLPYLRNMLGWVEREVLPGPEGPIYAVGEVKA